MKKIVRALAGTAVLVLWSKAVWAQWGVLPDPMQTDWTGGCRNARFLDGQNGYLVSDGQRPTFLKTTNGGASWTTSKPMLATAASGTQGISFILDANTAFATNDALVLSNTATNRVARTINGGTTWQVANVVPTGSPAALRFTGLAAVSATQAWLVGYVPAPGGPVLFKTTDGTTWNQVAATGLGTSIPTDVYFVDASTGVIATAGGILRSVDGGTTWTSAQTGVGAAGVFRFVSATTGFIMGSASNLWKTSNGGASWTNLGSVGCNATTRSDTTQISYSFFDEMNGTVGCDGSVGNQKFRKTVNGGTTWTDEARPAGWPVGTAVSFGVGCVAYAGSSALRFGGAAGFEVRPGKEGTAAPVVDGGVTADGAVTDGATSSDGPGPGPTARAVWTARRRGQAMTGAAAARPGEVAVPGRDGSGCWRWDWACCCCYAAVARCAREAPRSRSRGDEPSQLKSRRARLQLATHCRSSVVMLSVPPARLAWSTSSATARSSDLACETMRRIDGSSTMPDRPSEHIR